jgi:hypothetical protein
MYGNVEFMGLHANEKAHNDPWKAYVAAPDMQRCEAYDTTYRPDLPYLQLIQDKRRLLVNEYENEDGARDPGDATPFWNHLKTILPHGDDAVILLSWMSALIQYPGKKFLWSPFVQAEEGNGKGILVRALTHAIGEKHFHSIDAEDFCKSGNKFNLWYRNTRFAALEEINVGEHKGADAALKKLIDSPLTQVQGKGADQDTMRNCVNVMIQSNFKGALPIHDSSRRYAPLYCAQQTADDLKLYDMHRQGKYFDKLFHWLHNENGWEKTANLFDTFEIPPQYNPAGSANKSPVTTSSMAAVDESRTPWHNAVFETIDPEQPGFRGGFVSITVLKRELVAGGYKITNDKAIGAILESMQYQPIECLRSNRFRISSIIMQEDGKRPKLYAHSSNPAHNCTQGAQVSDMYKIAQGYASCS